mmetsp:Transcript_48223/g.98512  ORF Transcript_48223/g.98512 Transcript_48223/m.98512 type:complete len:285 (+) Transcript_48223:24-878(+)|eukprot:CAMPEP_0181316666 /NCGR_PEP_ID=MMETSP1101-20121128/16019_1 /TAXON_ID=46948 /ORGANISM="Rhodomonas abbreviata, Strain Caron Lab Isolate" /LENGTH=284 /DNA_ID=CAMNT_0023423933 /DNA_START=23 /DNA_END=877 /DNA_ORIENTATION=+
MAAARRFAASMMAELDSDEDEKSTPQDAVSRTENASEGKAEDATVSQKEVEEVAAKVDATALNEPEEEEEEVKQVNKGFYAQGGGKKMSKQQKRKLAKEAEEKRRYEQAKEEAKNMVDPRVEEDKLLATKLAPLKLAVKDVKADGHCLYRSVGDQCVQNLSKLPDSLAEEVASWAQGTEYLKLRRRTADFMRRFRSDFEPFVDAAGEGDAYEEYLKKIEGTAEWGGDVELTAMARSLGAHIHVHSATLQEQTFSPDVPSALHFNVSFHQHAYGLGEHYNSLTPL